MTVQLNNRNLFDEYIKFKATKSIFYWARTHTHTNCCELMLFPVVEPGLRAKLSHVQMAIVQECRTVKYPLDQSIASSTVAVKFVQEVVENYVFSDASSMTSIRQAATTSDSLCSSPSYDVAIPASMHILAFSEPTGHTCAHVVMLQSSHTQLLLKRCLRFQFSCIHPTVPRQIRLPAKPARWQQAIQLMFIVDRSDHGPSWTNNQQAASTAQCA